MHYNIKGEIDSYREKMEWLALPILFNLIACYNFLVIPKIVPKNKLDKMGNKSQTIKALLYTFMLIVALFIIYLAKSNLLQIQITYCC